jgi:hypothetical protein
MGSGIGFFGSQNSDPRTRILELGSRHSDPGSQTNIFDSLMTNFRIKSTIIFSALAKKKFLYLFKNKIIDNFLIFVATKNGRTKNHFSLLLYWYPTVVGSRIQNG